VRHHVVVLVLVAAYLPGHRVVAVAVVAAQIRAQLAALLPAAFGFTIEAGLAVSL
jgi:hypothetical protein